MTTKVIQSINLGNGLVGWWKMDEGSGNTTADASGSSNTGTLISSYVFTVLGITTAPVVGDAYTNNTFTFTITAILVGGTPKSGTITCTGTGDPTASGILARSTGLGDINITFNSYTNIWSNSTPTFTYSNPYCLNFNGVNQYVSLSNLVIGSATTYTITAWVYWNGNNAGISQYIFSERYNVTSIKGAIYNPLGSNYLRFIVRDNASDACIVDSAAGTFVKNTWYHVCGVRNGNNCYIYLNGLQKNVRTTTFGTITNTVLPTIGYDVNVTNGYWNGSIDDVRVYNRVLNDDEIYALSQGYPQIGGSVSGSKSLVGYWSLEEGLGNTTIDKSGNGNTGTLKASYVFSVSGISISPTATAVYTNNSKNFTVVAVSITGTAPNESGTMTCTGTGEPSPATSGTLTKSSGTGDATITYSSYTNIWANGKIGYCINLNSSGQCVTLPVSSFNYTNNFTILFWYNLNATASSTYLFSRWDAGTAGNRQYLIRINSINVLAFYDSNTTLYSSSVTNIGAAGIWNHITIVINGSSSRMYVNGLAVGSTFNPTITARSNSGNIIGGTYNIYPSLSTGITNAKIDEVRIYNRALTANEISMMYFAKNSNN